MFQNLCCRTRTWPALSFLSVEKFSSNVTSGQTRSENPENHASHSAGSSNPKEIKKFTALANEWWNPRGPFQGLHALNDARVRFIKCASQQQQSGTVDKGSKPLQGTRLIDVGCGGGILSEALARLGADVLGIDVARENIEVAKLHMKQDPALHENLRYDVVSAESLVSRGEHFDVVVSSEVIEHVNQPAEFCRTLSKLCAPSGIVVVTTMNRTSQSYALVILAAEYVLHMLPRGTHDWNKFITPQELSLAFNQVGMEMGLLSGMAVNPIACSSKLVQDCSVNYVAAFSHSQQVD